jgi:hypothetical protein
VIEDLSVHPLVTAQVFPEDADLIATINANLIERGACPPPPDWDEVRRQARETQARRAESWQAEMDERADCARLSEEDEREERARIAGILSVAVEDIHPLAWTWLLYEDEDQINFAWSEKPWERACEEEPDLSDMAFSDMGLDEQFDHYPTLEEFEADARAAEDLANDPANRLDEQYQKLVQAGETWWSLERNAAAAGYFRVEDYLLWRAGDAA